MNWFSALYIPFSQKTVKFLYQDALKTLSLDTDTWQAFQSACAELEITPEDCFDAWSNFCAGPESQETAMEFLKQESGNSRNLSP